MTEQRLRLMLAAKLLRRIADVKGMSEFEGETLMDIAWACSRAAQAEEIAELQEKIRTGFRCDVDESAGMAEVVELHGYSKKVGA